MHTWSCKRIFFLSILNAHSRPSNGFTQLQCIISFHEFLISLSHSVEIWKLFSTLEFTSNFDHFIYWMAEKFSNFPQCVLFKAVNIAYLTLQYGSLVPSKSMTLRSLPSTSTTLTIADHGTLLVLDPPIFILSLRSVRDGDTKAPCFKCAVFWLTEKTKYAVMKVVCKYVRYCFEVRIQVWLDRQRQMT